jgi:hypothetical protein
MRPHVAALKVLLDEPRLQIMLGCGDGLGAHLIEEAGCRTGFISGSSISVTRLADAGHGFGQLWRNGACSRDWHRCSPKCSVAGDGDTRRYRRGAGSSKRSPQRWGDGRDYRDRGFESGSLKR